MATLQRMLSAIAAVYFGCCVSSGMTAYDGWQISTPVYTNHLAEALVRLMNRTAVMSQLEVIFQDLTRADLVAVGKSELLNKMANDLSDMFSERMNALKHLVDEAELAVMNYSSNPNLKKGDVEYLDIRTTEKTIGLEYDANFKNKVNFSSSAVHIPIEIYEGYSIIQNELKWSQNLDGAFKRNYNNYRDLSWQFFGSQTGLMRVYPASQWKDAPEDIPDLYDVRRRPWYIEASTSPKDMLIMIDTSGSVHGQTLEIMKMSVKTLLNTLGENDYVNVASFSKTINWVSCFETFVQASSVNKMILFEAIDRLKDGFMASYGSALQFAFSEFKKFDKTKNSTEGANCHKVIMFFTDGGTEDPREVYMEENNKTLVRIFTFATGPHAVPVHTIKAMACNNKGYFSSIASLGAIRTGVQEYVSVLSRPMVLSGEKQYEWTNFYDDVMGLGMVTTVTLPVYNRSIHGDGQSIIGVMGIDIPVKSLERLGPNRQLGPVGYTFAINNNGFIVFHPDMKTEGDYLDDPPEVDLVDLEEENSLMHDLRRKMIDRLTGNVTSNIIETLPDHKYVYRQKKTYYYTPIKDTTFSLGLVIPADRDYYVRVRGLDTSEGLGVQESDGVLVAPWPFCKGYPDAPNAHDIPGLSALIQAGKDCDQKMVQRLLWDIQKTKTVNNMWDKKLKEFPQFADEILTIFLGTEGGLTRVYPPSSVHKFKSISDTWTAQYYRRALYAKSKWVFSASLEPGVNDTNVGVITAVKSVSITSSKKTFKPAVVGVQFTLDGLVDLLLEGNFADLRLPGSGLKNYRVENLPCRESGILCYLIDDGGYLVATNHENKVGLVTKFLGDVDPELMWILFENNVYTSKKTYNYQAFCPVVKDAVASADKLFSTGSQFSFHFLFEFITWIYLKFSLWSFIQSFWSQPTEAIFEFGSIYKEKMRCVTVQHQYYYGANFSLIGEFVCEACYRKISAMKVKETNLLFVTVAYPCTETPLCSRIKHLNQRPERVPSEKLCKRLPRYRKRPTHCYAHDKDENTSDCSGSASSHLLLFHLLLTALMSVFLLGKVSKYTI